MKTGYDFPFPAILLLVILYCPLVHGNDAVDTSRVNSMKHQSINIGCNRPIASVVKFQLKTNSLLNASVYKYRCRITSFCQGG